MLCRRVHCILVLAVIQSIGAAASAQCFYEKLLAPDGGAGDEFGLKVGIDGDRAVVGAHHAGDGKVYVYRFDGVTWTLEQTLIPADPTGGDSFGNDVAISGRWMAVGALRHDVNGADQQGAVYLFRYDGSEWLHHATITASDGDAGDQFGMAVDLSGDTLIVGAHFAAGGGAAYIYDPIGTACQAEHKLQPSDLSGGDKFGHFVAIDGAVAATGAHLQDGAKGAGYVYRRTGLTWAERSETKLVPADLESSDKFGYDVDVDGDCVVIGSHWDDDAGSDAGAAYVYRCVSGSWDIEAKLLPPISDGQYEFGNTTLIDGSRIFIGARHTLADNDAGMVYVHRLRDGVWEQEEKIVAADGEPNELFSVGLAIDGNRLIAGAFRDDDLGPLSGSAYVFDLDQAYLPGDWNRDGVVDVIDLLAILAAWGACP